MSYKKARKTMDFLADRMKAVREADDLSLDNISQITGLSKSTLSEMENKKSSPELITCLRICYTLDIKLSDLLKEIGE